MWGLFYVGLPPNNEVISDDDGEKKSGGDVGEQLKTATNTDEENAKQRLVSQKMRNQFDCVVEQPSDHKMAQVLSKTPLATVKGGPQSGNFLCHLDCNHFGEATHAPSIRKVPMGRDAFRKLYKPVMMARYGEAMADDVPEHLAVGEIYTMLDANKDRKRLFTSALRVKQTIGKNKNRTKKHMCYSTEASQDNRKKKSRSLQCTQGLWRVMNKSTEIPHKQYKELVGSNKSDMFGPVELEKTTELLTLPDRKAKNAWWGPSRLIDVGGKLSESEADDSDSGEEAAVAPAEVEANTGANATDLKIPICYHQMPPIILKELVWSLNIKHVLDLTPSPSTAAAWLIAEYGASYCCIAPTETAATWIRNKVHDDMMKMCSEEGTKLYAQCQLWSGNFIADKTPAPNKRVQATGEGGQGGAVPGAPTKRPKRTPKPPAGEGDGGNGGGTGTAGGGTGTGGGTLDIAALLAAAKAKAKGAAKGTSADGDEAAGEDE